MVKWFLALLACCGGAVAGPPADDTEITLERTACYGTCPVYRLTIHGSGHVEFNGERCVCRLGPATAQIDPAQVSALVRSLAEAGFDAMPNYELTTETDSPWVTLTLRQAGKTHRVRHYHGDIRAPRALDRLEDRVDEIAGDAAWIGETRQGERVCVLPDGTTRRITR